jgi:general secretion pathway protein D
MRRFVLALALFLPRALAAAPPPHTVVVHEDVAVSKEPREAHGTNPEPFSLAFTPKPPDAFVSLALSDADLEETVRAVAEVTGRRFLVAIAKAKSFRATIYAPPKITVAEAYHAFLAALASNGLTVVPKGSFLEVVDAQDAARTPTPVVGANGAPPFEERYITQLRRLEHASAEDIAQVLQKFQSPGASIIAHPGTNLLILTDTGTNLARLGTILREIDVAGADYKLWIQPVSHAAASDVEKKLADLLDLKRGGLPIAKIVALDQPNALAIVSTPEAYKRVLEVLDKIDVPVGTDTQVHVVLLQHADAKKLVGPLNEVVAGVAGAQKPGAPAKAGNPLGVLEGPTKISAEETTNAILVTSSPRDFGHIRDVIAKLDQPKRQVYIEAVVMDVSADNTLALGLGYHGGTNVSGSNGLAYGGVNAAKSLFPPSADDLQGMVLGLRGPDIPTGLPQQTGLSTIPGIGAFVSAVASSSGTDILSTPHVLASDNTPAEIRVQEGINLQPHAVQPATITTGGALGVPVAPSVSQNFQKFGPKITVTPHVNDSDEVRLDVEELISDVDHVPDPQTDPNGTITFIERAAKTTLTVEDEQTVVIGGLVRDRHGRVEKKVSILGDIPILGALFRSTSDTESKSNLLLVLTPHIIRNETDMRRIFERKLQERQEMVDHALVFQSAGWRPPIDPAHPRGLLAQMRNAVRDVEARRAAAPAPRKADRIPHEATEALDLPVPVQTWGAEGPTGSAAPAKGPVRVEH